MYFFVLKFRLSYCPCKKIPDGKHRNKRLGFASNSEQSFYMGVFKRCDFVYFRFKTSIFNFSILNYKIYK